MHHATWRNNSTRESEVARGPGTVSSLCCHCGKTHLQLPARAPPPEPLKSLLDNTHPKANPFLIMKNVRATHVSRPNGSLFHHQKWYVSGYYCTVSPSNLDEALASGALLEEP